MQHIDKADNKARPLGVRAGNNKMDTAMCPICLSEGDVWKFDPKEGRQVWFTFEDELSAKEYRISGLCQPCQNRIFATCGHC